MFKVEVNWKSFNVDLGSVDAKLRADYPNYVGNQAHNLLELWFTAEPTAEEAQAINAYWDAIVESSPEVLRHIEVKLEEKIKDRLNGMKDLCSLIEEDFLIGNAKMLSAEPKESMQTFKMSIFTRAVPILTVLKSNDVDLLLGALKSVPQGSLDEKYITEARLLKYANMIRVFEGFPEVQTLAEA